jgi:hypothetical protein
MLKWVPTKGPANCTRAFPCMINQGCFDAAGKPLPRPAQIYVDDALLAAVGCVIIELCLAAIIEGIFTVMGNDKPTFCQCLLAIDKWETLVVSPRQTILVVNLDTDTMMVSMTPEYVA